MKLPSIFGHHMVLQQGRPVPIWGWAEPGELISVSFAGQCLEVVTDGSGKWRGHLGALPAMDEGTTLTVSGQNRVTFDDVVVGDVWLCSGQSNMALQLQATQGGKEEEARGHDALLRFCFIPRTYDLELQDDVAARWVVCTSDQARRFSGVGYYFGRDLREALGIPLGLIGASFGGIPIQTWISLSGLQKDPAFSPQVEAHRSALEKWKAHEANYLVDLAKFESSLKVWKAEHQSTAKPLYDAWKKSVDEARAAKLPLPRRPITDHPEPRPPKKPDGGHYVPTVLYNAMIAPIVPYAMKGVIWYQGEGNLEDGLVYTGLFARLLADWREKWDQGEFPFLFVQLANFHPRSDLPCEGDWPWLREAQRQALALPGTGMAVAIDLGEADDIHPRNKRDVGLRLARIAKHLVYGKDLVYSGPSYESWGIEGSQIRLHFQHVGGGLVLERKDKEVSGFALAGSDQHWVWADAEVNGNSIVVSHPDVPEPRAVRYAWANNPPCTLRNREGLPASPFRTDDWTDWIKG